MFRLLLLIVLAAAAFVMIDARWAPDSRTLTLRVRTAKELMGVAQGTARELGDRAMRKVVGDEPTPSVSAPPPARREISYAGLGVKVGLSKNTLARLAETKTDSVEFTTLDKLCAYFDCTIGDLLEYVPDEKPTVTRSRKSE